MTPLGTDGLLHPPMSYPIIPIMGIFEPNMGMIGAIKMNSRPQNLANALFTTTQQRILGYLYGQPDRSFFANQLIQLTGSGTGAVQRELQRLEASGLATTEKRGNQKHYQANPASPIYEELRAIVQKTFGMAEPLKQALAPLCQEILAAFIYGSVAKQRDTAASDIDLMIVSNTLTYPTLYDRLVDAESHLQRQINPTILTREELNKRIKEENAFIVRMLSQPKFWLIGAEYVLAA